MSASARSLLILGAFLAATLSSPAFGHGPDQSKHRIANLSDMTLEAGGVVKNLKMSYVTHGKLNAAKNNAILLLHGFAANHHNFDFLIGPGKPFDTSEYFIIAADAFGSTQTGFEHSTSPTSSGLKMGFPPYNGRDMVTNEAISTPAITGRQQAAKPAVGAPVDCKVRFRHGVRSRRIGEHSVRDIGNTQVAYFLASKKSSTAR